MTPKAQCRNVAPKMFHACEVLTRIVDGEIGPEDAGAAMKTLTRYRDDLDATLEALKSSDEWIVPQALSILSPNLAGHPRQSLLRR